jgi:dTDP-4-amino-4,6-dideoxygalactose transaminase
MLRPFKEPIYITRPPLPNLKKVVEGLKEVWESRWLTNGGPKHQLLEDNLRRVLKVPALSLFNNGTTALMVACRSLGLQGEVITTPFTFPATPHILSWLGCTPVFCDIDPVTMNIDAGKIEPLVTKRTTGILAVHVFGTPCDVRKIQRVAHKYNLKVIYDAAHAFEVEIDGEGIGNFGDASMFSFHATKLFHTAEGGALAFKRKEWKKEIDWLKNFGIKSPNEVVAVGVNGKMSEVQAVLGLAVLGLRNRERVRRRRLFETYQECLEDVPGVSFVENPSNVKNSYQYFVIRINEKLFGRSRDYVYKRFKEYNVFTRKYFFPLCSDYPHYRRLSSAKPGRLPVAHRIVDEALSLPFYGGLSQNDVERICAILKSFR